MPRSKAKEAFLRRHNLASPRLSSPDATRAKTPPPTERREEDAVPHRRRSLSHDDVNSPMASERRDAGKSWAQKRKEHIVARATGEVTHRSSEAVVEPHPPISPRDERDHKTWKEKRKENFLATHNAKPKPVDVGATAIMFASKLLRNRTKLAIGLPTGESTDTMLSGTEEDQLQNGPLSERPSTPSTPTTPREKSWKQKRKESYLARHSPRNPDSRGAHVAVTAVSFAVRLRQQSQKNRLSSIPELS